MTCTPVMAPRDLNLGAPETPWLQTKQLDKKDATPKLKAGGIVIQKAKAQFQQVGGVPIKKRIAPSDNKAKHDYTFLP